MEILVDIVLFKFNISISCVFSLGLKNILKQ